MNLNAHIAGRQDDSWRSFFSHALIWLLLSASVLVLAWFMSVVEEVTQRGEQRRVQQGTAGGAMLLVDDVQARGPLAHRVLPVGREIPPAR